MDSMSTPIREPLRTSINAPSKRKLAERVFGNRPVVLNLGGRKRQPPDEIFRQEREKALKQLGAAQAKVRRLDATEARAMRRNQRFRVEACQPDVTMEEMVNETKVDSELHIVRILLAKGAWLELNEAEYDYKQDERLYVLRYVEGFAGKPAPYTTVAEMRAHARGQEERRKQEGDTEELKQAFADGLSGVFEVYNENDRSDNPERDAYEDGQDYRTMFEWFFAPGEDWVDDLDGMREFHLMMAAKGQASTPIKDVQRLELDDDVWLVLGPDEQDIAIDDPILLTRFLEGVAGIMHSAQYKTVAESKAHSKGVAQRSQREGITKSMCLYSYSI